MAKHGTRACLASYRKIHDKVIRLCLFYINGSARIGGSSIPLTCHDASLHRNIKVAIDLLIIQLEIFSDVLSNAQRNTMFQIIIATFEIYQTLQNMILVPENEINAVIGFKMEK